MYLRLNSMAFLRKYCSSSYINILYNVEYRPHFSTLSVEPEDGVNVHMRNVISNKIRTNDAGQNVDHFNNLLYFPRAEGNLKLLVTVILFN
jgi:hypothetical protein